MALFGKLFGGGEQSRKPEKKLPWKPLTSLEQLEEILVNSKDKPQLIFKHSTTCGISGMVLRMITSSWELDADTSDLYFLDLHAYREVSNEAAIKFQVIHQSPQLIIVSNGQTTFHTSHGAITDVDINKYL
ncbi:bacillithiol system redox-active protein YtxJ [Croceivirga thetidis]|uniref:Bacillithiol system redox-active protein YtxJ n=1 Tax=Croceivirga thetidis TaxID=2721623 RepID=A0ABX1GRI4_9FLAO|nr:bacillithiol system redox-active protein YtxJ [Croceivirga thetidis]NKI32536.1 bacillithiol system redox-active protein YtxJ [Croceivirga thetidis]